MSLFDAHGNLDELALVDEQLEDGAQCRGCGCSQTDPCPGGCVWATEDLCSACVLEPAWQRPS